MEIAHKSFTDDDDGRSHFSSSSRKSCNQTLNLKVIAASFSVLQVGGARAFC
jgi:hypothetical protein